MPLNDMGVVRMWTITRTDIDTKTNELYHYGIQGQKWGERRFENEDGTLTEAGKERYRKLSSKTNKPYVDIGRGLDGKALIRERDGMTEEDEIISKKYRSGKHTSVNDLDGRRKQKAEKELNDVRKALTDPVLYDKNGN